MSWHFLQGQEEASWEGSSLAGAPSALLSSMPTAAVCSWPVSVTVCSDDSQSGMTCGRSTGAHGADMSMSSAVDSRAKTSAPPGCELGSRGNDLDCGVSSRASSKKFDQRLSSSRILRTYALADLSECSRTLIAWGTTHRGVSSERTPLALHKNGGACGLLPAPTGAGNECSPSMRKWPRHRRLMELFARLPSPRHTDADRSGRGDLLQAWRGNSNSHFKLPTPTARLYGSNQGGASGRAGQKRRPSLEALTGGPWISFREWMMGWPIGWTALEPLAMDRFQEWLRWHGRR